MNKTLKQRISLSNLKLIAFSEVILSCLAVQQNTNFVNKYMDNLPGNPQLFC